MPLLTTRAGASVKAFGLTSGEMPETLGAMVLVSPTSVTGATGTASANSLGKITFTGCSSISVNGVFTSTYANYMIVCRMTSNDSTAFNLRFRLRASGTDATGSNYSGTQLFSSGTSNVGELISSSLGYMGAINSSAPAGFVAHIYGPQLAQTTPWRSLTFSGTTGEATIYDQSFVHSVSSSYDGFTLWPAGGLVTGVLSVYGFDA